MILPRSWTFWTVTSLFVILVLGIAIFSWVGALCGNYNLKEAQIEIGQLGQMVDSYHLASNPRRLPSELKDLTEGPSPLTKEVPKDPWGNPYVYVRHSDSAYEIWSVGPDGINHTEDDIHAEGVPCAYQVKTKNRVPNTEYRVPSTPKYKIIRPAEHARGGDQ